MLDDRLEIKNLFINMMLALFETFLIINFITLNESMIGVLAITLSVAHGFYLVRRYNTKESIELLKKFNDNRFGFYKELLKNQMLDIVLYSFILLIFLSFVGFHSSLIYVLIRLFAFIVVLPIFLLNILQISAHLYALFPLYVGSYNYNPYLFVLIAGITGVYLYERFRDQVIQEI